MSVRILAQDLLDRLRPGCERIEIAGSIRRGKADPKDIELVAVPRITDAIQELDLFGNIIDELVCDHLHNALQGLYAAGAWELDRALPRNGPKYKRLRHIESGICCDLFIATRRNFGLIFAIRTGPGDYSKMLVTKAACRGLKVDGGQLWQLHRDGRRDVIPTPEEADFFRALGMPMLVPEERGRKL